MTQLQSIFRLFGYEWPSFHLIGIRSKEDKPNEFDDDFYLIAAGASLATIGTTNPGRSWLRLPGRVSGTAVLKSGQYINTWQLGLHRGMYRAWTQAKPVPVHRDNNKDDKSDETNVIETGMFGINIHRAHENHVSKLIDKWSAGCQVICDPEFYKKFIELSQASMQKYFTYTLLRESDL